MRRALLACLMLTLSAACENPCIQLCQQYERYLDRCGFGWSTVFHDRGWSSIDDCYDDYWDAESSEAGECQQETEVWASKSCY